MLALQHIDHPYKVFREALGTASPAGNPVSTHDWLRPVINALINVHAASPQLHRVIFDEAPRTPQLTARFTESQSYAVERVAALFRDDPELNLSAPERTAIFVVATLESLTHRFFALEQPPSATTSSPMNSK